MAKSNIRHQLTVSLPTQEYPILIGRNILQDADLLRSLIRAQQVLIVTNTTIAPLYLSSLQAAFAALKCNTVILPDGEQYKNADSLALIYDELITHHHHRDTTIVALGGGVVGDMAGYAAATYQRGVQFIQIPTTLLAQVDASVGGKTAINHPLAKNMIGSFYQPKAVLIDVETLNTLPPREFIAGMAEVVKYGLLVGGDFWTLLQDTAAHGLTQSTPALEQIIAQCCAIKADYVIADEHENGIRAYLNLGHTFAHALESMTHYQRWLHGEAVAIGLYCAALLSYELGDLSMQDVLSIDTVLKQFNLPRRIPKEINLEELTGFMAHDKKIMNQQLRFIVMKQIGTVEINGLVTADCLRLVLQNAVEGVSP